MQAQQHKPIHKHKQRLNAGEVIVAMLDLLVGMVSGIGGYGYFRRESAGWESYAIGGALLTAALGAGLAALLIFLRQRRLTISFQWLAVFGMLLLTLVSLWICLKQNVGPDSLLLIAGIPLMITLLLVWFAWFLKRMDESK